MEKKSDKIKQSAGILGTGVPEDVRKMLHDLNTTFPESAGSRAASQRRVTGSRTQEAEHDTNHAYALWLTGIALILVLVLLPLFVLLLRQRQTIIIQTVPPSATVKHAPVRTSARPSASVTLTHKPAPTAISAFPHHRKPATGKALKVTHPAAVHHHSTSHMVVRRSIPAVSVLRGHLPAHEHRPMHVISPVPVKKHPARHGPGRPAFWLGM